MRGATVCWAHGGSAPQVRKAAARRLAEAEARRTIAEVEIHPIDNPLEALADLAAEATAWKSHLANTVAALRDQYRFTDYDDDGRPIGNEHLDARVALFERAMDRCQKYLADWVRLGFEERAVALKEAQLTLAEKILRAAMDELLALIADRFDPDLSAPAHLETIRAAMPDIWRRAIDTTATSTRGAP